MVAREEQTAQRRRREKKKRKIYCVTLLLSRRDASPEILDASCDVDEMQVFEMNLKWRYTSTHFNYYTQNLNPGQDTRAEPKLEGHRNQIEHSEGARTQHSRRLTRSVTTHGNTHELLYGPNRKI
jgi:hypothetical protein